MIAKILNIFIRVPPYRLNIRENTAKVKYRYVTQVTSSRTNRFVRENVRKIHSYIGTIRHFLVVQHGA